MGHILSSSSSRLKSAFNVAADCAARLLLAWVSPLDNIFIKIQEADDLATSLLNKGTIPPKGFQDSVRLLRGELVKAVKYIDNSGNPERYDHIFVMELKALEEKSEFWADPKLQARLPEGLTEDFGKLAEVFGNFHRALDAMKVVRSDLTQAERAARAFTLT